LTDVLPEPARALLDPRAYPDPPRQVTMGQTQMSWLFFTDDHVYKVKKPVDLGYLDYTTLEQRRFLCHQEVELNRRLCPDVYLGVVAISRRGDRISIDTSPSGEVIEYAVKMRRLPQAAMMDVLLTNHRVTPEMVARVARRLAEFHRQAATSADINAFGTIQAITTNTEENFTQTEPYIGRTISAEQFRHIRAYTDSFLDRNADRFRQRITDGKIRDCHGDLHAAHICFDDGICIYDCIEFNDRFRYCDVASEVAFLVMDLDYHHEPGLGRQFVAAYVESSRDPDLLGVLNFYECYRAYVRGKVEGFKLDDPYIAAGEKTSLLAKAQRYFDLAAAYI